MDHIFNGGWAKRVREGAALVGLVTAAVVLPIGISASYAASPVTVDGNFSLSYTPTNGSASNMSFSSTPGDGAVTSGPGVGFDLGANTMSGQTVTNNPFFMDGHTDTGQPGSLILPQLTVGTPVTLNFFTASPSSTCSSCGASNTATGTITASFTFSEPSGATGNFTDTAAYSADYNTSNPLACSGLSSGQSDCVVWSATNDPVTVNFTDGAVMTVTLTNAQDWAITPTLTFKMTKGPTAAPEPATLALFGTAMAGLGLVRRRRKAV